MADNNSGLIIKVGIFGAVAYYAYSQGWLSSLGIGTAAAVATTPATTAAITPVVPVAVANTLSEVQAATILQANAPAAGLAVDDWGWYLNNVLATIGNGKPAPDPMPIFTAAIPGFVRSQLLTAAQYWAVMAPALTSQLGLSGLGMYRWTN